MTAIVRVLALHLCAAGIAFSFNFNLGFSRNLY
jgi:hypothetical protein